MKKIMTMVAMIAMIATANASNKNTDNAMNEPTKVAPFTEVNVNVPARIKLVRGEEYGVMANAIDMADVNKLDYRVKDGVLYISTESMDMLRASGRGTVITVFTPADNANIKIGNDVQAKRMR